MSFSDAFDALLDLADGRQVLVELPLVGGTEVGRELSRALADEVEDAAAVAAGGGRGPRGRGWCRCRRRAARRPAAGSFPAASASPVRATPGCWCRRTNSPESQLPTVRESSQPISSEPKRVAEPSCCAAIWSTEMPFWMSAPAVFLRVHAGQVRRPGARVVAGPVAERVAVACARGRRARACPRGTSRAASGCASTRRHVRRPSASSRP